MAPSTNVPAGRSYWEFGVNENYQAKALADFTKRTLAVSVEEQAATTYVFVSPWTWDSSNPKNKIEDWAAKRRKEGNWKDVIYIDGAQLETWLEARPAVAAWHARNTLKVVPQEGVRSTDDFWDEFAGQFAPALTEDVLLCERQGASERLLQALLNGNPQSYVADSADEVIAFAVAAIRRADPATRLFLEARTLVVDSSAAGRQLPAEQNLILLLGGDAGRSPGQLALMGTPLVALGRQQKNGGAPVLPRQTGQGLGAAIRTMGIDENEALTLARGSGGSLAALARLKPSGSWTEPAWLSDGQVLLPAILAGGWNAASDDDRKLLEDIANGRPYADLEADLRRFGRHADPPFDLEGSAWKVRAPMDAFIHIGPLVGQAQAQRLQDAMVKVFGVIEEKKEETEVGVVIRRGLEPGYSEWLREGLATTLLLIAVRSEAADFNLGNETGQAFADRTLELLPGLRSSADLIMSLGRDLPTLAEAAPGPLLSALEHLLEGEGELIRLIFVEKDGALFPRSRHTGVLWALETLAWDPSYFRRAVLVLAGLAAIDPGGKLANRPFNSLGEIFVLWNPNTNAPAAQRLAVLDEVIAKFPVVGWSVVRALLPITHGVSSPTAKPRLREGGASERAPISYRELGEMQNAIVDRAMVLVGHDEKRWSTLLHVVGNLPSDKRRILAGHLEAALEALDEVQRKPIWIVVRDEVSRHERFGTTARWALPAEELAPLKRVVDRFAPADPLVTILPMFDNWALDGSGNMDAANAKRLTAVSTVFEAEGASGVFQLLTQTRNPYLVVQALEASPRTAVEIRAILEVSFKAGTASDLTRMLLNLYLQRAGEAEALAWVNAAKASGASSEEIGQLLLSWPGSSTTWAMVRRFGQEVVDAYWTHRPPVYAEGSRTELIRSTLFYLRYRRALAALQAAFNRLGDLPSQLLLLMLDNVLRELNSSPAQADTMLSYYLEGALAELDKRPNVQPIDIAKLEYSFLPILEHGGRALRIHDLMAENAGFYHEILRDVFLSNADAKVRDERGAEAKTKPETEAEKQTVGKARQGYTLLSNFERLPGMAASGLDRAKLTTWIDEMRRLGQETDRAEITDNYVGRVLAHAPRDDDGAWPLQAVRDQIERLDSDRVDRAIQLERFNMRGVHSRGVFDGGDQERELARSARESAKIAAAWPRTAAVHMAIAVGYDEDARRNDVEAAQRKLRS